jgi:hypothetical protein
MAAATDTLTSAEILEEAGVPRRQAAAQARAIDLGCAEAVADLPTRAALKALEVRLLLYGVSLAGLLFAALRFG